MKLYIDCDGVLLDTIKILYEEFDRYHELEPNTPMSDWLRMINWPKFLQKAGPLNDSVEILKVLPVEKVSILTTINSVAEAIAKVEYLRAQGVKNEIIFVPSAKCDKSEVVPAKGNVLIDDHGANLEKWEKAGGIAIQFSTKKKTGKYPIIDSLIKIPKQISSQLYLH